MDATMDRIIDVSQLEGWIPIQIYWKEGAGFVDWCFLGCDRFTESSLSQTVDACLSHPANLLFRHQTPIDVLRQWSDVSPGLQPSGFIFHTSRCGSTLISQMLNGLSRSIVISEARPIDSVIRAQFGDTQLTDGQRVDLLRAMISALGNKRSGAEEYLFIKFDAWHAAAIPFIRLAFPDVPWIFVYRDPIEVLVSQLNQRDAHMIPGLIDPGMFGLDLNLATTISPEEYCARVLASICSAGFREHQNGGMLVNYTQLPHVVLSSLVDFFRLQCSEAEREVMTAAVEMKFKNEASRFGADAEKKQHKASDEVSKAAEKWVYPVYEKLERARLSG
jgi:hypothetical protein